MSMKLSGGGVLHIGWAIKVQGCTEAISSVNHQSWLKQYLIYSPSQAFWSYANG
jgi:hypothetical protein